MDSFNKQPSSHPKQAYFSENLAQRGQGLQSFGELPSDEQEALIGLTLMPGIGPGLAYRLLQSFGDAVSVFAAPRKKLMLIEGIGISLAERLIDGFDHATALSHLAQIKRHQIHVMVVGQVDYPMSLLRLSDPPTLLFLMGQKPSHWSPQTFVALVGTRQPDRRGVHLTTQTAKILVEYGYTIVSGGALGIDTAAHSAAIAHEGTTLAVVATGVDRSYPSQNKDLFRDIRRQKGALISEFLPGTMPEKGYFPRRNRLISALCCGVVVIQCGAKSGALNTAAHAKRMGIPVYTFPGRPKEELAAGPHQLIRNGENLIESGQELIQRLQTLSNHTQHEQLSLWCDPAQTPKQLKEQESKKTFILMDEERQNVTKQSDTRLTEAEEALDPMAQQILSTLQVDRLLHVDEIAAQVEQPVAQVSAHLLQMELEGLILAHPGMYFTRVKHLS